MPSQEKVANVESTLTLNDPGLIEGSVLMELLYSKRVRLFEIEVVNAVISSFRSLLVKIFVLARH